MGWHASEHMKRLIMRIVVGERNSGDEKSPPGNEMKVALTRPFLS